MFPNYLFRGWSKGGFWQKKGWIEGSLIQSNQGRTEIINNKDDLFGVVGESVGQATAMMLANGSNVFSGDILDLVCLGQDRKYSSTGVVFYCEETFSFRVKDTLGESQPLVNWGFSKLIGNTFENKNLFNQIMGQFNEKTIGNST